MSSQDQTTQTPAVGIGMNSPAAPAPQPAPATADASAQASRQPVLSDDNLACQWDQCKERCQTAEALYEHICERHVGRKSTNNLNLTCGWTNCRTTTVKRDHITSHIRVHVPLKPHKCVQCGKSFKRPQDLKKHVKTHADDSVLVRSPDGHPGPVGGYRAPNGGRGVYQPHYPAGPSGGYYEPAAPHMQQPNGTYGAPQHHAGGHNGYYQPQPQGYGMGYYPQVQHGGDMGQHNAAVYDQGKKSQALGDFFGDAKGQRFDPSNYPAIGSRLMALNAAGINSQTLEYYAQQQQMMGVGRGGPQVAAMAPQHYSLPIPNLKGRTDLAAIDTFLDQVQHTIYENQNPVQAAAAGIHQPGGHYIPAMNYRQSHSPPTAQHNIAMSLGPQAAASTHTAPMVAQAHSPQSSTPALTPPSGNVSYTSGQSPVSAPGLSPSDTSRHASTSSAGYPVLPAVSSVYAPHSSASPASTLGTNFDSDPRKRYSGGMLQKAAGARFETPSYTSHPPNFEHKKLPLPTSSNIDPALGGGSPGATSPGAASASDSESKQDENYEQWLENIRLIEGLRKVVQARMAEVEEEEQQQTEEQKQEQRKAEPLYPVLQFNEAEH